MIALSGAFGFFHFAQQRIHLVRCQCAVGPYGAMAGHGAEKVVLAFREDATGTEFTDVMQHATRKRRQVAIGEHGGHRAHGQRGWRQRCHVKAQFLQCGQVLLGGGHVQSVCVEGHRDQQSLCLHGARIQCRFQLLIEDAFMRGVHVHQHQSLPVLRQHIDAMQLRDGVAKRMRFDIGLHWRCRCGIRGSLRGTCHGSVAGGGEESPVVAARLGNTQAGLEARCRWRERRGVVLRHCKRRSLRPHFAIV